MKEYTDYSEAYSVYPNTPVEPTVETFTAAVNDTQLRTNYNTIAARRKEMDNDLKELYNTDNSRYQIYQSKADAAAFAGILWVVLASTLVYIVFTKL
jgi:primase-polymerase (primpol)-like protein